MALDRKVLKKKLLAIAKQQSIKLEEEVQKQIRKSIKLEKNKNEKWVKIIYLGGNIRRKPINEEGFKRILNLYLKNGEMVEYEIINREDFIKFQFKDDEIVEKIYNHYNNFFFGNMRRQAVNNYLTKYINDLIEEGCATGTCGAESDNNSTYISSDESNNSSK
ncbi:MAG: hypothetical protein ACFFD2_07620 [Promethearchaeota archaeon]